MPGPDWITAFVDRYRFLRRSLAVFVGLLIFVLVAPAFLPPLTLLGATDYSSMVATLLFGAMVVTFFAAGASGGGMGATGGVVNLRRGRDPKDSALATSFALRGALFAGILMLLTLTFVFDPSAGLPASLVALGIAAALLVPTLVW